MARGSNSESESNRSTAGTATKDHNPSSTSQNKQRLTSSQQQYLNNLTATHVTNNHPTENRNVYHPLDFQHDSDEFLRNYKDHYNLSLPDNMTVSGYLLGSQLGSKTYSFKRNKVGKPDARILKSQLAEEIKDHFNNMQLKEVDIIPQFIYKIKNKDKKFKMEFNTGS
ncbi:hypothetical protein KAFR_0B03740 [Kazachstania africana CBS 2517]|uniref:Histone deacetylase complex subunit SAP30 Sin3 binding domain-containing protein n=1 Tax=Kazachstania africana (strain ATCC 22294 / BCRC 22015 / CBS 2517 / CECT 1963 / NBRC 1671 / NRRL Y-8276) TaxID=1071382 RepID=H2AQM0_KAZAF|nr:hypothetical protein KAFR_0B03740 [Kazachstania africana CBS 2517]CCF56670.1 hypothetical protein KAFR_0B03740 [Kazachstania africana CBS 2517]